VRFFPSIVQNGAPAVLQSSIARNGLRPVRLQFLDKLNRGQALRNLRRVVRLKR
jgi:hypothetical protein